MALGALECCKQCSISNYDRKSEEQNADMNGNINAVLTRFQMGIRTLFVTVPEVIPNNHGKELVYILSLS